MKYKLLYTAITFVFTFLFSVDCFSQEMKFEGTHPPQSRSIETTGKRRHHHG